MGRVGTALCTALLLAGALAGCSGDDRPAAPRTIQTAGAGPKAPKEFRTPVEAFIGSNAQRPAPEEIGHWWLVPFQATPEGQAIAFAWNVPPGAKTGGRNAGVGGLALELAPIVVEGNVSLESFCFLTFVRDGSGVRPANIYPPLYLVNGPIRTHLPHFTSFPSTWRCEAQLQGKFMGVTAPAPFNLPAALRPSFLFVEDQALVVENQTELLVVVAARAPTTVPFGVAFRALNDRPGPAAMPAPSQEEFVRGRGTAPHQVRQVANVSGFAYGDFRANYTTGLSFPDVVRAREARSAHIEVEDRLPDLRPASPGRDVTISFRPDTGDGWSYAYGDYKGNCNVGRWSVAANLHGTRVAGGTVVAEVPVCSYLVPYIAAVLVVGQPRFSVMGEGPDAATVSFTLSLAGLPMDTLAFRAMSLGAPLEKMFGSPGVAMAHWGTGAVGNIPPS